MRAYILGVPDRYRGQSLEAQLSQIGFPFAVVDAPDASAWPPGFLETVYSRRAAQIVSHRRLSPGEVACVLGHRSMMASLVETGDDWALFLEDDAIVTGKLDPIMAVLGSIPDGPTVIDLDNRRPPSTGSPRAVPNQGGTLSPQPVPGVGTAAYLMNRSAALTALRAYRRRRVDSTADWPFCWSRSVRFWQPDTEVVRHPTIVTESLVAVGRQRSYRNTHRRGRASSIAVGVLQLVGIAALYGRVHNIPLIPIYRRDLREGQARLTAAAWRARPR